MNEEQTQTPEVATPTPAPQIKPSRARLIVPALALGVAVLNATASASLGGGVLDGGTGIDAGAVAESAKDTVQNVAKAGAAVLGVSVAVRVAVKWVKRIAGFA